MRIVVLDGYALNPGDLDWAPVKALGECTIYDRTTADQTIARAAGAEVLLTNKVILDKAIIEQLPALRYIGIQATGYNTIDVAAAKARGVVVTNVPGYSTPAVAQMTMALLLELCHGAGLHARAVREGRWSAAPDFCFWLTPQTELNGKTMGLVGFGRIGQAVAACAQAFGMRVIAHGGSRLRESPVAGVPLVSLDTVFREADVVSLHCPLTADNRQMVNRERLALMKPTAFLINTARGPLIDEPALAEALHAGKIAGAALDVLTAEPPSTTNPLFSAPNCVITPHIAWASQASRNRLLQTVAANIAAFQNGKPQNVVG